ncbi:lipocalin family protein [Muriicola sp. Z0-33]|uniref:lipocalin family protein n=1 Tax=Muriicola sp. Z0-33 TaxID=2816957 RepID=UPI002237DEC9|nr:lipocalin family protein [Muriicola sp. Z0-33]MCW5516278.1 lipocalin family protein [Muriicola sp. Z0-33]
MMKRNVLMLLMAAVVAFSCSSDKEDAGSEASNIEGTWDAHELMIDNATASDDEKNGRDLLNFLTAKDCFILSLTFNQDLTVITENSVNYLEINVNGSGTGLDVPCPTQSDMDNSTYTYDGQVVTFVDENAQTVSVDVSISGNTMTVDAADLDIPNFNTGGQLIFIRR